MSGEVLVQDAFDSSLPTTITKVANGQEALILSKLASNLSDTKGLVHVCANSQQVASITASIGFFAPWLDVVHLPAWDCLPYDRVSPSSQVVADRIEALSKIAEAKSGENPFLVLTSVNALVQRYLPISVVRKLKRRLAPGQRLDMDHVVEQLASEGFERVATVRERGEFAIRGGILDMFVPGNKNPVRLDFFGDILESIRSFDPFTQLTKEQLKVFEMSAMSEVNLNTETILRFRQRYVKSFGAATRNDSLYQAISEGRRFAGMEHWLPLFYDELDTLFSYIDGFKI